MNKKFLLTILFFCMMLGSVAVVMADYYKYTDASGAVNITNKMDSVPQKYRSRVKVISDDALSKRDTRKQQAEPAQEESATPKQPETQAPASTPQGKFAELSARYTWFKALVYLGVLLAAFLVVIKLATLVPSPQLSKLIYLSFFLGVMVFLYKAYVQHVVDDSLAVKEKAISMIKKSSVREVPLPGEDPGAGQK